MDLTQRVDPPHLAVATDQSGLHSHVWAEYHQAIADRVSLLGGLAVVTQPTLAGTLYGIVPIGGNQSMALTLGAVAPELGVQTVQVLVNVLVGGGGVVTPGFQLIGNLITGTKLLDLLEIATGPVAPGVPTFVLRVRVVAGGPATTLGRSGFNIGTGQPISGNLGQASAGGVVHGGIAL